MATLAGLIALVGCTPGTGAGPSAGGSPPGPSSPTPSADPSAGGQLRHKVTVGTAQLVLVPFERSDDDMALVLTNASGLAELKCSKRAEPQSCSAALKSISELFRGSKDGWNTGETVWVGQRGKPDEPALPLLLRHPLGGKIDLIAVLNPERSRTSGPNSVSPSPPAAPSPSPTRTSTATESPTGSEEPDAGWTSRYTWLVAANGDPEGGGQAGRSTCDPWATIDSYIDIEGVPDLDHPSAPARLSAVRIFLDGRMETICLF